MSAVAEATRRYERWLSGLIPLDRADLDAKHAAMAESRFAFLRASYYRWAQLWPVLCADLAGAGRVLAVGDLHVDNFGTWRDAEARFVWGVNDVDEAHAAAWPNDLVRLAASAMLARDEGALRLRARPVAEAVLAGYAEALAAGGAPFVLEERHGWLRRLTTWKKRDPDRFWAKLEGADPWRGRVPRGARDALEASLPRRRLPYRLVHRRSGLGSLGRPRVTALATVDGGLLAREAKPLLPSAGGWAVGRPRAPEAGALLARAVRAHDPHFGARGGWTVRRLAPHCVRVDLDDLPPERDEARLLAAMGSETANLHLGSPRAAAILRSPALRAGARPLLDAAQRMLDALDEDWRAWRRG